MSAEYVTNSLVWSAIGLMLGLVLGMGIRIKFLYWKLEDRHRDRVVGSLLILTALISIVQGLAFQREQRRITECQVEYNSRFQDTLRERSGIADRDRNNVNAMILAVLDADSEPAVRKALEKYTAINEQLNRERNDASFPAMTGEDTCKDRVTREEQK